MRSLLVLLLAASLYACKRGQDDKTDAGTPGQAGDIAKQAARAPVYPEPEALGVLNGLDDAEVAVANVARDVSQNDDVLQFASVLATDHRALKQIIDAEAAKAGLTPRDNAAATQIRAAGDSVARMLLTIPAGFNNTWLEEQVKAHQQAIAVLDTAVMPSVANPNVHKLLEQARPTLVAHLQRALQILSLRRQQAAERGEAFVSGYQAAQAPRRDTTAREPATVQPQPPAPQQPAPPQPAPDTTQPPPTTTSNM